MGITDSILSSVKVELTCMILKEIALEREGLHRGLQRRADETQAARAKRLPSRNYLLLARSRDSALLSFPAASDYSIVPRTF